MRVQVSKKMVNMLNRTLRNDFAQNDSIPLRFDYRETGDDGVYRFSVGDPWSAEQYGDYNYLTGKYKYIYVLYPDACYALPNVLTSKDLCEFYHEIKHDGLAFDEFAHHVINAMAV